MAIGIDKFELIDGKWVIEKDPQARLDYFYNMTEWLQPGEILVDVVFTPTGGLVVDLGDSGFTNTVATVWLTGGNVSRKPANASCTAHFVTNQGREDDRTFYFSIVQR